MTPPPPHRLPLPLLLFSFCLSLVHTPAIKPKHPRSAAESFRLTLFLAPVSSCRASPQLSDCCSLSPCCLSQPSRSLLPLFLPQSETKNVCFIFFYTRHPGLGGSKSVKKKRHEINVMSMMFSHQTPRRSVKVTLHSLLIPRWGREMEDVCLAILSAYACLSPPLAVSTHLSFGKIAEIWNTADIYLKTDAGCVSRPRNVSHNEAFSRQGQVHPVGFSILLMSFRRW